MKVIIYFIFSILFLFGNLYALQTESAHFIYYYEAPDSSIIDSIKSKLESNYDRITGDLQLTISYKIIIHIYPTLQEFHNAIGQPNAPDWLVGTAFFDVFVVSPQNPGPAHSYNEMMNNVLVHEFTHVCTYKINSSLPIWLSEGFALFEAGPYYSKASVVSSYNSIGKIPTLDDLSYNFDNFVKFGGYPFSLTIVHFIAENYGMDAMRKLIHYPNNFSVFEGLTKSGFQDKWFEYVKKNYLGIASGLISNKNFNVQNIFSLEQNHPNPFNPETVIGYQIPYGGHVELKVYNILGKEIAVLVNEDQRAGNYKVKFEGNNLPSGIYIYRLSACNYLNTKKMILLK